MIDLRQLRYFVALAETLHFGRAAERLHVTQPPLSRQLAALERELGVTLIERTSRQVRLTPAGESLLGDARKLLADLERACRNAQLAAAGERGQLTIGFMMHAAYGPVPALTRRFLADFPQVQLNLREVLPVALAGGVLDGSFDAGIGFSPGPTRGLRSVPLHREALCLAVPIGHPLAGEGPVTPDMLLDQPLIAAPADVVPTLRRAIEDFLARAGGTPTILLETQLQQTIVSLVSEGIGIALVPRSLEKLGIGKVVLRELADAPVVEQVLVWREANENPALAHLLALAAQSGPSPDGISATSL